MRYRHANPHKEGHNVPGRNYDWILPVGTDVRQLLIDIRDQVGINLVAATATDTVDGFAVWSFSPEGIYINVHLYDHECSDPSCLTGHKNVKHRRCKDLTGQDIARLRQIAREHNLLVLGNGQASDDDILKNKFKFKDEDAPLLTT